MVSAMAQVVTGRLGSGGTASKKACLGKCWAFFHHPQASQRKVVRADMCSKSTSSMFVDMWPGVSFG